MPYVTEIEFTQFNVVYNFGVMMETRVEYKM